MNDLVLFSHPDADSVERQLVALKSHFAAVLGPLMQPERLIRTIMVSLDRTPKLYECNRQTIFMAAMSAACLGLEVDGVTGQGFLLPFKGRCQLITGYKGYNTLAARGGYAIRGDVVREGDVFEYDKAQAIVSHKPKLGGDGRIIAAWALAASRTLPAVVEVIGIDELMEIKARAPGAKKDESPWNDPKIGFPAMCGKTPKRRMSRSMPLNVLQYAARMDEAVEEQGRPSWIDPHKGVIVEDAEVVESPIPQAVSDPPEIVINDDVARSWPGLAPQTAVKAEKLATWLRGAVTTDSLEKRWKHRDSEGLKQQIKIASARDYERLVDIYDQQHARLSEMESASKGE